MMTQRRRQHPIPPLSEAEAKAYMRRVEGWKIVPAMEVEAAHRMVTLVRYALEHLGSRRMTPLGRIVHHHTEIHTLFEQLLQGAKLQPYVCRDDVPGIEGSRWVISDVFAPGQPGRIIVSSQYIQHRRFGEPQGIGNFGTFHGMALEQFMNKKIIIPWLAWAGYPAEIWPWFQLVMKEDS